MQNNDDILIGNQAHANWSPQKARQRWHVTAANDDDIAQGWGGEYFTVNDDFEFIVKPDGQTPLSLNAVCEAAVGLGMRLPMLLRFTDVLTHRLQHLRTVFDEQMTAYSHEYGVEYAGAYLPVYPIKVNQQSSVVLPLCEAGVGLEAGSKSELVAVLGVAKPRSLIICNGYKDREFIRLALIGQVVGHDVVIVLEKASEWQMITEEAERLAVTPKLGIRIRLSSVAKGNWQNTGGEKSKFGLSISQTLKLIDELRAADQLHCLQMLHVHLGSQIADQNDLALGMQETARHFIELYKLGAPLSLLDVGGGLAIDYQGMANTESCSMNYSDSDYARIVITAIGEACTQVDIAVPSIITETGRALVAHHAVLLTNVIDKETRLVWAENQRETGTENETATATDSELNEQCEELAAIKSKDDWQKHETAFTALYNAYRNSKCNLEALAAGEARYYQLAKQALEQGCDHDLAETLREKLADKLFLNLSFFQSIPDVWGIDQIFPIMPIQRLYEPPTRRARLFDLTCDSDGRIDQYVDSGGLETTLPVHALQSGEHYLLGIFMVGAYQEILGDLHNLFGDTDAVDVLLTEDGFICSAQELGDTTAELLQMVHFDPAVLMQSFADKVKATSIQQRHDAKSYEAVGDDQTDHEQNKNKMQQQANKRADMITEFAEALAGYTYHEDE